MPAVTNVVVSSDQMSIVLTGTNFLSDSSYELFCKYGGVLASVVYLDSSTQITC